VSARAGHGAVSRVKRALRALRTWPPLNLPLTSTARAILRALHVESELAVRHLHRAGTVRCRLPNGDSLALWSRGDDWVSTQLFWRGLQGYEPETVPWFFRLARRSRLTFDVGAYVGFYTVLAARANPGGRVYAFEPHPRIYARLQRNVALNRLSNVECLQYAAGDADGSTDFYHVADGLPTSSSLSLEFMSVHPVLCRTSVQTARLDTFARAAGLGPVDLVKLDTESTEPDVLRGMAEILQRDHPWLVCEVLAGRGSEEPLEAILGPLGYKYYLLTPDGPLAQPRVVGHPTWLNYLFAEKDPYQRLER
jgi:FkbM family methyltransferase